MPGHSPRRPLRRRRPLSRGECARAAGSGRLVLEAGGGGWAAAGRGPPAAVSPPPPPPLLRAGRGGGRRGLSPPRRCTEDLSGGRGWRERVGQDGWSELGRRRAPSCRPLPPPAPQPGAGRGQVQTGAPGTSRVFLPPHAATHPRNTEEADTELREDLCMGSPGKWSSQDAHSLHTQPLPAVFSGEPLCTSLRRLRIERICDPEARRSPARFGLASTTQARPSLDHGLGFGRSFEAERLLSF